MATSLSKIHSQIEKLQKQAALIRSKVIPRIKREIAQHGLTMEDLFGTDGGVIVGNGRATQLKASSKKSGADKPAKFADERGNTWHGVGKRPTWIRDLVAAGHKTPRVRIVVAPINPRQGAAMKDESGKVRTSIQGQGCSAHAAA